ncbi:hypothetical protein SARC_05708 [Sphaeroforma arctica JP610]|uniref:HMA domain-containing protein n=1 Tax=Sphaeroforma arctica JP610 TaxID=667725 RepID=A0A0L0FYT7_9EUKA|nr:hypothetical protein SARC_05708 [Sphaeroforma arctica JP610]KNC81995.1 hypothetical protein SARC_05708 [Sphaeroforma arctica JP610]|eukprot:XP_014155897.1 hypothetical protein SARC_05708 [Sphaeroforma arctica JP610]
MSEWTALRVLHMTCHSCVNSIEGTLGVHPNIKSIKVNLEREETRVNHDATISPAEIAEAIDDMGFEASVLGQLTHIAVAGMTCNSCVKNIEGMLGDMDGVVNIQVSLSDEDAWVVYESDFTSPIELSLAIEDMGFDADILQPAADVQESQQGITTSLETTARSLERIHTRATVHLSIEGMTCNSCVQSIESTVGEAKGVRRVSVSLDMGEASVEYAADEITADEIVDLVNEMGFEAVELRLPVPSEVAGLMSPKDRRPVNRTGRHSPVRSPSPLRQRQAINHNLTSARLSIEGMTCTSCVKNIEVKIGSEIGVLKIKVDLVGCSASVTLDTSLTSSAAVAEAIEDMGFEAAVVSTSLAVPSPLPSKRNSNRIQPLSTPSSTDSLTGGVFLGLKKGASTQTSLDSLALKRASSDSLSMRKMRSLMSGTSTSIFKVTGMTCASCVANIERAVQKHPGVVKVTVGLLSEKAEVEYDATLTSPAEICAKICAIGFGAVALEDKDPGECVLTIKGMTCSSCVANIERNAIKLDGVTMAAVSLATNTGKFQFDADKVGARDLIKHINNLGFDASLSDGNKLESMDHSPEVRKWKHRFLFCLVFFVLTFIVMLLCNLHATMKYMMALVVPGASLSSLLIMSFATIVQFVIGKSFVVSAYKSLRHGSANMDLLVSLGSSCAYVYSFLVTTVAICTDADNAPANFFETSIMLFTFVCLGRWLEHIAKGYGLRVANSNTYTPPSCPVKDAFMCCMLVTNPIRKRLSLVL